MKRMKLTGTRGPNRSSRYTIGELEYDIQEVAVQIKLTEDDDARAREVSHLSDHFNGTVERALTLPLGRRRGTRKSRGILWVLYRIPFNGVVLPGWMWQKLKRAKLV